MDKLIVTSLRVNKNQRKFAPSLKKVKKNKSKKVDKDQKKASTSLTSNNVVKKNVNNENKGNINNSVSDTHQNLNRVKDSTVNAKDSVVIKKLDTLKESRFFGISQPKVTPKKNSISNTRLKLLAEVQDEEIKLKNNIDKVEHTNRPESQTTISSQQNDSQLNDTQTTIAIPTTQLVNEQSQLSSSDDTLIVSPTPILSPMRSQVDTQNDSTKVDVENHEDIMTSVVKDEIDNTPQSISIPSTPKNNLDAASAQSISIPSTPKNNLDAASAQGISIPSTPKNKLDAASAQGISIPSTPKNKLDTVSAQGISIPSTPKNNLDAASAQSISIPSTPKNKLDTVSAQSISIPSTPKNNLDTISPQLNSVETTPKNNLDTVSAQSISIPTTPVTTNDNTRINTPQTNPSLSQSPNLVNENITSQNQNASTKFTPIKISVPTQDTISSKELEQKIQKIEIPKGNIKDSPMPAIPISLPTSLSTNNTSSLISSNGENDNTLKISHNQDLKVRHQPILSQQQNSPNRKRKIDGVDSNDTDDASLPLSKKQFTIDIPFDPRKKIISDLGDDAFALLNSKLDKLVATTDALKKVKSSIDRMEKEDKSNENDDGESEMTSATTTTTTTTTSEYEDTTFVGTDSEMDKVSVLDDDIEDEKIDIDDSNDSDYQEPSMHKKIRVKKAQSDDDDMNSPSLRNFKQFSEIEKVEEPIVFNKRTLADIIDNYHGKERSNIQKERYKIAARKRKATLRKKRLRKLAAEGAILDPEELEPSIEVKREAPPIRQPNENVAAVQMRVVNGEVVIDQSSLFINHIDTSNELPITMMESRDQQVTSLSFKKNSNRSKKWKKDETDLFYQCLSICGTDFGMMSVLIPNRNRKQLINKYHRETRLNPERIRKAFEKRKMLDNNNFNAILEKINQNKTIDVTNTEE